MSGSIKRAYRVRELSPPQADGDPIETKVDFVVQWEDEGERITSVPPDAKPTKHPIEVRPSGPRKDLATRFRKGNKAAQGRKPSMVKLGVPLSMCDVADPRYRKLLRNAGKYRKFRSEELARVHGFLSAGASSMVASASLALAGSKWLYLLAAETVDTKVATNLVTMASKLSLDAIRAEQMAWEISSREAAALKAQRSDAPIEWLTGKATEESDNGSDEGNR